MQKEARHSAVTGVKFELAINLENWCGQLASRCRRGFLLRADEVIEMSSRREFIMLLGGATVAWPQAALRAATDPSQFDILESAAGCENRVQIRSIAELN
jgi:hypothetical protein